MRAGLPVTMAKGGTSVVTTLPAPIMACRPILSPGRMVQLAPSEAPASTTVSGKRSGWARLRGNLSLAKATFGGNVTRLQVTGVKDLATTQNEIRSKLQADKSIDAILGLNPQVGYTAFQAAQSVKSTAKVGSFDLSTDLLKAIQAGKILFAVDQQQYLQGYLPIVFLYLNNTNANTVGGGKPILTGPGFVDKTNASKVIALAGKGTR